MVPFTEKERSSIGGFTEFFFAAKAKLSESKKLDAVLQQEMEQVDIAWLHFLALGPLPLNLLIITVL
uniref:Uncharacterized protein n=1 Tax=Caenorhabditis japonica TaxID=281687 RepID=A0A8R1EFU7_CAEJA